MSETGNRMLPPPAFWKAMAPPNQVKKLSMKQSRTAEYPNVGGIMTTVWTENSSSRIPVGPLVSAMLCHEPFRVTPFVSPTLAWALSDRKSTRLNSSPVLLSYAVFFFKKLT